MQRRTWQKQQQAAYIQSCMNTSDESTTQQVNTCVHVHVESTCTCIIFESTCTCIIFENTCTCIIFECMYMYYI